VREEALRLYTGALLEGHDDLPWVEPRRQQLQRLYARALHLSCKERRDLPSVEKVLGRCAELKTHSEEDDDFCAPRSGSPSPC
jgi:DNA-binding SARP family transcriptional activator